MIERIPESTRQRAIDLISRTPLDGPIRNAYRWGREVVDNASTSAESVATLAPASAPVAAPATAPLEAAPTTIDLRDFASSSVSFSVVDDVVLAAGWVIGVGNGVPSGVLELRNAEGGVTEFPIRDWHAERGRVAAASPDFFRITVDHIERAGAAEARVHFPDVFTSDWEPLGSTQLVQLPASETLLNCDVCGLEAFTFVGRRQGLEIRQCNNCRLLFTSPRPARGETSDGSVRQSSTHGYGDGQTESAEQLDHWNGLIDRLEQFRIPNASLLEIGSGSGGFIASAKQRGWSVVGADASEAAVEYAKGRGLDVRHENIEEVDTLGRKFDCIVLEATLERLRSPRRGVAICADALKPGGVLLLHAASVEGTSFHKQGLAADIVSPGENLFLFSSTSLTRLVGDAGLEVQSMWVDHEGDYLGVIATKSVVY